MELELLKQHLPEYLQSRGVDLGKASRSNTACPVCGNGHKTGCFHYYSDTMKVKCYSCGFNGDLFDLIAEEKGISNAEAIAEARKLYGSGTPASPAPYKTGQKKTISPPAEDLTSFFKEAAAANDFEYLKGRGISEAIQKRFMIGFVPDWISPQAVRTTIEKGGNPANLPRSPRCIIPTSRSSYIARDTRESLTDEQKRYSKQKQGAQALFNLKAFEASEAVFVTEGEIDAMSIEEAGGAAVGLGSVANIRSLLSFLQQHHAGQVLILCLDNDEPGQAAQIQLAEALHGLDIRYIEGTQYTQKTAKDPNEALMKDPAAFREAVSFLQAEALKLTAEGSMKEYRAADLLDYFRTIEEQPEGIEAKTGFRKLDEKLQGGLHEGLYIIGAISSLGKTTFTLQLADQIASTGQDVLFFSLEMSKTELMAKSISRYSFIYAGLEMENTRFIARDTAQIMNNRRYKHYSEKERQAINEAIKLYSLPAENMYIYEGRYKGQRLTVQHIKEITLNHRERTGRTPIVFVDYLQIIAPADVRASDKQNTDTAVFELKELSRDLKTAVFAISSFNRDNYTEPVNMASFKESGAVEYSSDVLFGLQYAGMDYQPSETEKNRTARLRDLMKDVYRMKEMKEPVQIELKCLKNRNGYQFTICFEMQAAFNYFAEVEPAQLGGFTSGKAKRPI